MTHATHVLAAALSLAAAVPALAQDAAVEPARAVSVTASADVLSRYVWRGLRLSHGAVVQPSVGLEARGFSASLWWNVALSTPALAAPPGAWGAAASDGPTGLTETDLTLGYARPLGGSVDLAGGVIYYGNRGAADTTELYASLSREMPLNPSLTLYYDVDEGEGALALLSVSQELPLAPGVPLSLSAAASYDLDHRVMGGGWDEEAMAGFYHGEVSVAVSLPLGRRLVLSPRLTCSFPLTAKARQAMESASVDGRTGALLSGGIGAAIAF